MAIPEPKSISGFFVLVSGSKTSLCVVLRIASSHSRDKQIGVGSIRFTHDSIINEIVMGYARICQLCDAGPSWSATHGAEACRPRHAGDVEHLCLAG